MKILVFGAGPLGSLMAVRLHEAGHDVTMLARNQRLADIREHGIVIHEDGAEEPEVARVKTVEAFGSDDEYDLVMIVMRKNQADQIVETLGTNKRVPTFLFMTNCAEGPRRYADALGAERVMFGFPLPGGHRDGHVVEVVPVNEQHVWTLPVGETDGRITERTRTVAKVLGSMRGYKVQIRRDMDAWLRHHVALLMPAFAPALYAAGISMKRMGRTRDLNVLAVRGMREAVRGLRKAGVPISPRAFKLLFVIPEPLLVALFARAMTAEKNRASIEGHPKNAREELRYLTEELLGFLKKQGIDTPVCDSLFAYYDPQTPLMPDGSRAIPLKWTGVLATLAAIAAAVAALIFL